MKIVIAPPPIFNRACEVFDLKGKRPVFTYGDTIYNPFDGVIDEPLMAHEEVHMDQQANDPAGWWERYFTDKKFRFEQEVEAYRRQYRVAKKIVKDRNRLAVLLSWWSCDLSGPMYGSMCTQKEAMEKITWVMR